MQIFYIIYCIIVYIEYFPRIIKLIRTKSSNDYSLSSTVLSLLGMACWVLYIFSTEQDLVLYLGSFVDVILNVVFAVLVFKYHDKKE